MWGGGIDSVKFAAGGSDFLQLHPVDRECSSGDETEMVSCDGGAMSRRDRKERREGKTKREDGEGQKRGLCQLESVG